MTECLHGWMASLIGKQEDEQFKEGTPREGAKLKALGQSGVPCLSVLDVYTGC